MSILGDTVAHAVAIGYSNSASDVHLQSDIGSSLTRGSNDTSAMGCDEEYCCGAYEKEKLVARLPKVDRLRFFGC